MAKNTKKSKTYIYPLKEHFFDELKKNKGKYICTYDKTYISKGSSILIYRSGKNNGFVGEIIVEDEVENEEKRNNRDIWLFKDAYLNKYIYNVSKFVLFDEPIKIKEIFEHIKRPKKEKYKGYTSVQSFLCCFTYGNACLHEINKEAYFILKKHIYNKMIVDEDDIMSNNDNVNNNVNDNDNDDNDNDNDNDDNNTDDNNKKTIIELDSDSDQEVESYSDIMGKYEEREINAHIPIMVVPNIGETLTKTSLIAKKRDLIKKITFQHWDITNNNDMDFRPFIKTSNIEFYKITSPNVKTLNNAIEAYIDEEEYYFEPKNNTYPCFKVYEIVYDHPIYKNCYIICFMTDSSNCAEIIYSLDGK